MITREQFEAHVRAEAEKVYSIVIVTQPGRMPPRFKVIGPSLTRVQCGSEYNARREKDVLTSAYITTRMEHEWPLILKLQRIEELAKTQDENEVSE